MGVEGLLPLVEDCPEACRFVSIEKMANDHQRVLRYSPVLAVDGSNVIPWLYTNRRDFLESIYGGQWIQFREVLKNFVLKFQNKGIELVFIFDGTTCKDKLSKWLERRMSRYGEIASIFNDISRNFQEKAIARQHISRALKRLAKFALKELDVKMYRTDKEMDADKYIADYANKNRAVFAILSDDSDFIILDTKPVLSISKLRLNQLKTVMYDRYSFVVRYLNISPEHLPLFGCLIGIDYVPFLKLGRFHRRLSGFENPST
ncbi:unnamed protein product [Larinioides sclopetarius]|uniref:XPG N-terminal domain-containing protein n=1 Tax=Larinioides sclopetarius TaxID=280406 RepID=A0AAV2B8U1_9ARAC